MKGLTSSTRTLSSFISTDGKMSLSILLVSNAHSLQRIFISISGDIHAVFMNSENTAKSMCKLHASGKSDRTVPSCKKHGS